MRLSRGRRLRQRQDVSFLNGETVYGDSVHPDIPIGTVDILGVGFTPNQAKRFSNLRTYVRGIPSRAGSRHRIGHAGIINRLLASAGLTDVVSAQGTGGASGLRCI